MRIGHVPTADVTAKLVWNNGKAAALQAGTIVGSDGTKFEFITNREGITYIHGLPEGTYQAVLDNFSNAPFSIQIPTNKNIVVDLGVIQVPTVE